MKVLVTGFEPFGKFSINSSERAVSMLPKSLAGNEIVTVILPVSYTRSEKQLLDCMRSVRPDAVVCVGQNASSGEIRVESTAGNYAHSEEEDADHNLWLYRSIDMSGAPSYRSTLPIEEIVRNIKNAGITAEVSHSAGTFVCNCLMYLALRACETEFAGVPCGFVHVPALPEQCSDPASQPNMPPEKIAEALRIAVATVIDPAGDGMLAADEPVEAGDGEGEAEAEGREGSAETGAVNDAAADTPESSTVTAGNAPEEVPDEDDDDDDFSMAAGVTPEMLAAINDDDDDEPENTANAKPSVEAGSRSVSSVESTDDTAASVKNDTDAAQDHMDPGNATDADSSAAADPAEPAKATSAASAAMAYFSKTKRDKQIRDRESIEESEIYYGGTKKRPQDGTKTGEVLKRISGSVPERVTTQEAPKETLFEPARERATVDLKDYRVFSVDSKYRGTAEGLDQMTLTEFMEEFIPEREKTEKELREEAARTLIHEDDARDPRTYLERKALRDEARRKEDEKEHVAFGDLYIMNETMRAMGKTVNKSVLVDDDVYSLLYTALEDGGDIWAYHIAVLDSKGNLTGRVIGELPVYAIKYERYYVFRALTENKKIVCDPDTYEIRLEDL